ncbi:unnamed protein product [Closterium sp. Naga37s-1]|nr:unnamed protein product [Closterium sp. Naga37s-1]
MGVKLQIQLLEARGLPPKDNGGARDAFVRFQMGGSKARSRSVAKDNNPTWQEEFLFSVSDLEKDELLVTVWDKSVFLGEEFLGQLVLPVRQVLACDSYELQAMWFPLQNRLTRPRATVTGDILISASLWGVSSLVAESVSPSALPSSPLLPPTPPRSAPSPALITTVSLAFPKPSSAPPPSATPPSASPPSASPLSASPPSAPPPSAPSPSAPALSFPLKPALRRHTGPSDTVTPTALSPCGEADKGEAWGGGGKLGPEEGVGEGEGEGEGKAERKEEGEEKREGEGEAEREGHDASANLQGKEKEEGAADGTAAAAAATATAAKPRHQILQSLTESLKPNPQQLQQLKQRLHASKLSAASAIRSFGHAVENSVAKAGQSVRAANAKGGGVAPVATDGEEGEGESRRGSLGEGDGASGGGGGEAGGGAGGTGEAGEVEVPGVWWEQDMRDVPSAGPMPGELAGGGVLVDQAFDAAPHVLFATVFKPGSPFFQEFAAGPMPGEVPGGGVLVEQAFDAAPHVLFSAIFKPGSPFFQEFASGGAGAEQQQQEDTGTVMHRTVSYMTAPSSLVKSVQATEEVLCVRADAGGFLVAVTAKTPDVPYGGTFEIHLQFCITPLTEEGAGAGGGAGEGANTGEQSSSSRVPASAAGGDGKETGAEGSGSGVKSRLRVSYEPHFLQSTMMKSMIENGVRTGLKESYATFLSVSVTCSEISQVRVLYEPHFLQNEEYSQRMSLPSSPPHWCSHKARPSLRLHCTIHLPLVDFFIHSLLLSPTSPATLSQGDHGKKAVGDGWLLTVSLVEGGATEAIQAGSRNALVSISLFSVSPCCHSSVKTEGDHGKKAVGEGWLLMVSLVEWGRAQPMHLTHSPSSPSILLNPPFRLCPPGATPFTEQRATTGRRWWGRGGC